MLPRATSPWGSRRRKLRRLYVAYVSTGGMSSARATATHGCARTAGSTGGGGWPSSHHRYPCRARLAHTRGDNARVVVGASQVLLWRRSRAPGRTARCRRATLCPRRRPGPALWSRRLWGRAAAGRESCAPRRSVLHGGRSNDHQDPTPGPARGPSFCTSATPPATMSFGRSLSASSHGSAPSTWTRRGGSRTGRKPRPLVLHGALNTARCPWRASIVLLLQLRCWRDEGFADSLAVRDGAPPGQQRDKALQCASVASERGAWPLSDWRRLVEASGSS